MARHVARAMYHQALFAPTSPRHPHCEVLPNRSVPPKASTASLITSRRVCAATPRTLACSSLAWHPRSAQDAGCRVKKQILSSLKTEQETLEALLQKIREKRRLIAAFVSRLEPTGARLTNLSIVCGAVATALTAGPAIGGKTFTNVLGPAGSNASWRIFCGAASVFSLIAAIATSLYKSHDIATRISKAQACDAKLDGLQTRLELGQMPNKEAAKKYEECLPEIAFIASANPLGRRPSLEAVSGGISEPKPDQLVGRKFSCSGWVKGLGPGLNLWLAVELNGRIWPKESPIYVEDDGSWEKNVFEQGASDDFSLSLFAADTRGNKHVRAWLDAGDKLGTYPELRRTPGMIRLDNVNVRLSA